MKIKKKDVAIILILIVAVLIIRPGMLAITYQSTYTCGGQPSVTYPFVHDVFTRAWTDQITTGCAWICDFAPWFGPGCPYGTPGGYASNCQYTYTCFRNDSTSNITSSVVVPSSFTSATFRYSGFSGYTLSSAGDLMDVPSAFGLQLKIGNSTAINVPSNNYAAVTEIDPCTATTEYYSIKTIDITSILAQYKGTTTPLKFILNISPSTYQTDFNTCYQAQAAFIINYSIDFVVPPTTCSNTCPQGQTQNAYPDCACHLAPAAPPGFSNIVSQLTTLINQVLTWFRGLFGI